MSLASTTELSIIMPCLNEAETLEVCIVKANRFLTESGIVGEVIIADNGSTDGSQDIARRNGARVIDVPVKGYGTALMAGINSAHGRYAVIGDSDDSYDFSALMLFIEKLRAGYQLVMGNRFVGGIAEGAMPCVHEYLGNPVLSFIGRLFFGAPVSDFHCGLRGFDRSAIQSLNLKTTGMEFASEMVVKATLHRLKITEVPTTLSKDGRSRPPHLRTWRDGWRHLIFLLLHSPRWLFLIPGVALTTLGVLLMAALIPGTITIGKIALDVHTLLVASTMVIVGMQIGMFGFLAKQYASQYGVLPEAPWFNALLKECTLERTIVVGLLTCVLGVAGLVYATLQWGQTDFGPLDYKITLRQVIPSTTLVITGLQIVFFGFFSSLLKLGNSKD
jgi:glycosyltransferase involved in cell wall biosynthesis